MPLLPASGYATPAAPTIEPSPVPSTPYQRIDAPVGAFGGATSQALSGFGKSLGEAAGHLENIQQFYDQVVVDEQKNSYETKVNNKLYGDPSMPGDTGYMGSQGKNALEGREGVRRDIDAMLSEHRSTLKNANQLRLFDQDASRYRNVVLNQVGRHYDEQYNKHAAAVADDTLKLKLHEGAVAANNNNFNQLKGSLESALVADEQALRLRGADDVTIKNHKAVIIQGFTATWAETAIERNAPEGKQFVLDHKDELGDKYDNLLHKATAASTQYDVERMKNGLPPVTSQPNLVRGGAVGDAVDKFLDLTAQHESGWRNIHQGLVSPTVSTAQGYYQITNTTWRSFAPGAGVDLAKYPTAMTAPPEMQRQVARHIVTTSGVQHWTDYNPTLRSSALSVGLPVSGPISGSSTAPAQPSPTAGTDQPPGTLTPPSAPPSAPRPVTAIGDSLTQHLVNQGGAQGKGDRSKIGNYRPGDTTVSGFNSQQILDTVIPNLPAELVKGKDVTFSTGISNYNNDKDMQNSLRNIIPAQLAALHEQGAKNIVVMGVGPAEKLKGVNEALAAIAAKHADWGVTFAGPQRAPNPGDPEKLHSRDQKAEMGAVQAALATRYGQPASATTAVSSTPEAGVQATAKDLRAKAASDGAPLTIRTLMPEEVDKAVAHTGFGPDQPLDLANPQVLAKTLEAITLTKTGKLTSADKQVITRAVNMKPEDVATQTVTQVPGAPMPSLPPNEPGELPDGEVPGLLEKLKQGAKLLPPGAKPEVWNAYVRSVRQDANMAYNQQMHAERQHAIAQAKTDKEIGGQYYERMVPGGTNRPSDAEIRTDKRLSLKMRENLIGALNAPNHPQPNQAVSEANRVEAYQRLGGEVNGKPQLRTTDEIAALMFHPDVNQRITWNQFQSLDEVLQRKNHAKRQDTQPHITQLLKDAERVIFPLKHMKDGVGIKMDEEGPVRERRYQNFIENTVNDYITEGKDVRKLFDPGAPDKPNPEYLGSRAILDRFGAGAKPFGRGQANTVYPTEGELKDNPSIMKAYREGRFGEFGTAEAIEAAKQYSIRAGLGMRKQVVPESGVPVR